VTLLLQLFGKNISQLLFLFFIGNRSAADSQLLLHLRKLLSNLIKDESVGLLELIVELVLFLVEEVVEATHLENERSSLSVNFASIFEVPLKDRELVLVPDDELALNVLSDLFLELRPFLRAIGHLCRVVIFAISLLAILFDSFPDLLVDLLSDVWVGLQPGLIIFFCLADWGIDKRAFKGCTKFAVEVIVLCVI